MIGTIIDDFEARARNWKEARDIVYNVINCSKLVVSAIRGPAVGVVEQDVGGGAKRRSPPSMQTRRGLRLVCGRKERQSDDRAEDGDGSSA